MDDLVNRLRQRKMLASAGKIGIGKSAATNCWITDHPDPDCDAAADEIERLRALGAGFWVRNPARNPARNTRF